MALSRFQSLKGPLARALSTVAQAGSAPALAPVWAEMVGPVLAGRSRPLRLADGELLIEVEREFLGDLQRAERELHARLTERLGTRTIRRIAFVLPGESRP